MCKHKFTKMCKHKFTVYTSVCTFFLLFDKKINLNSLIKNNFINNKTTNLECLFII